MVSTTAIAGVANYLAVCRFYFIGVPIYSVSDPRYAGLEQGKYLSHGAVEVVNYLVGGLCRSPQRYSFLTPQDGRG